MSRAVWARVRTGIGPSFAAMPPNSSRVIRAVEAPNWAARNAAITPAGPAPMTITSVNGSSPHWGEVTISQELDARQYLTSIFWWIRLWELTESPAKKKTASQNAVNRTTKKRLCSILILKEMKDPWCGDGRFCGFSIRACRRDPVVLAETALCKRRLHQERSAQAADPPDEGSVHRLASTSSRCLMWMRWHTLDFDAQSLRRTWGDFSVRVRSICALFVGLVLLSLA